ncbi:MAG: S-layer homology domain-containing protein [Candidatus Gracilibacteria bacterium]|nr:S-layer homology domain-containing protein [Candidatus Gracilibacteria bacterium]
MKNKFIILLILLVFLFPKNVFGLCENSDKECVLNNLMTDVRGTTFEEVILNAYNKGVIKGYESEKKFKPDNGVSFIESLAIITNTLDKKDEVLKFEDINEKHWSDKYKALYNSQDKTGYRFYTNDDLIHRDFAIYLMLRHIGIEFRRNDYSKFEHNFKDVEFGDRFAPYIAFAYENGITQGYSEGPLAGSFGVSSNITRGEITAFSFKVLNMKEKLQESYKEKTGRTASISATSTNVVDFIIKDGIELNDDIIEIQGQKYSKNLFNDPTKTEKDYEKYIIEQEFNANKIGTIKNGTIKYNDLKRVLFSSESEWRFRNGSGGGAQLEKIPGMDYEKKLTEREKIDWLKEAVVKEGFVLIDENKVNDQIINEIKAKGIKFNTAKESKNYFSNKYNEITKPLLDGKDYLGYFSHDGNLGITWISQDGNKRQNISAHDGESKSNIKYPLSSAGAQGYDNLGKESTLVVGWYVFEFFYSR